MVGRRQADVESDHRAAVDRGRAVGHGAVQHVGHEDLRPVVIADRGQVPGAVDVAAGPGLDRRSRAVEDDQAPGLRGGRGSVGGGQAAHHHPTTRQGGEGGGEADAAGAGTGQGAVELAEGGDRPRWRDLHDGRAGALEVGRSC